MTETLVEYPYGKWIDITAAFPGAAVFDLRYEVTLPSGDPREFRLGRDAEVTKMTGANGNPDAYMLSLEGDELGDWTIKAFVSIAGKEHPLVALHRFRVIPVMVAKVRDSDVDKRLMPMDDEDKPHEGMYEEDDEDDDPKRKKEGKSEKKNATQGYAPEDYVMGKKQKAADSPLLDLAIAAVQTGQMGGRTLNLTLDQRSEAITRIRQEIASLPDEEQRKALAKRVDVVESSMRPDFYVKSIKGELRWYGKPTLNTWDRDGEVVSKAALTAVVEREKAAGNYPPLQFFHIDYDIGYTDDYRVVDGILLATGGFEDDPVSQTIAKYFLEHPEGTDGSGWGMSWRFRSVRERDGVFKNIRTIKEFTLLPHSEAANSDTSFEAEVVKMRWTEEQRKALDLVLGNDSMVKFVEQHVEARETSKELDEAGVARKSVDPAPVTEPVKTPPTPELQERLNAKGLKGNRPMMLRDLDDLQPVIVETIKGYVEAGMDALRESVLGEVNVALQSRDEHLAEMIAKMQELTLLEKATLDQRVYNDINDALAQRDEVAELLLEKTKRLEDIEKEVQQRHEEPEVVTRWKYISASSSPATIIGKDDQLVPSKRPMTKADMFDQVGLKGANGASGGS
jgi:hypothetical protein